MTPEPPTAVAIARRPPSGRRRLAIGALGALVLTGLPIVILATLDWNALRGPIGRYISVRTGRPISIEGDLDVTLWSRSPGFTAQGVRIGNPAWAGQGDLVRIDRLTVHLRAWSLLRGQVILTRLIMVAPKFDLRRDTDGRRNWDISNGANSSAPFRMPPVRQFAVDRGRLSLRDARRRLTLNTTLEARETLGGADRGLRISGAGTLNGRPFAVRVTGGPLLNLEPEKPYPFTAALRAGATEIRGRGALARPFDLGRAEASLTASGPDLAELYDLTGAPFPNTPPYRLSGRLSRDRALWSLAGIGGRIGDSDMSGALSIDTAGERPFLRADLRSRSLDFDDLAAIFGGPPSTMPGETASDAQRAMGARMAAQRRLLPDAPLNLRRIRSIDADVTYSAAAIRAPHLPLPLRAGAAHVSLKSGLLTADRLRLDLPQGSIAGRARLDARGDTPVSSIDLVLSKARLEQLLPVGKGGIAPLTGALAGRVKLTGSGFSVRQAMSDADGQVLFVAPGGEIREAFAELLGVNLARGLGLLWRKDQGKVELRCAVAHFQARDGVLTADKVVFDTEPVLAVGTGRIDLSDEQLDFRLSGKPKAARLLRLSAPISIRGPIVKPKVGLELRGGAAQGGAAAALAAVTPLAALLPFIDLGLAKDAPCGQLVAGAARKGAPATRP